MSSVRESVFVRLERDGKLVDALAFVLGRAVDPTRTAAMPCPEPSHHLNGDASASGIVCPKVGGVKCAKTGETYGLARLLVLEGRAASVAEAAKLLEAHFYGTTSPGCDVRESRNGDGDGTSANEAAPRGCVAGGPDWPWFPKTAEALGWTVVDDAGTPALRCPTFLADGSTARTKIRRQKTSGGPTARFLEDGSACGILNVPALIERSAGSEHPRVALVCGETDLLAWTWAAKREGIDIAAVSHSTGEASSLAEFLPAFRGVEVYFFPDADEAGRTAAPKRVEELRRVCAGVRVATVPAPHKDVCDFIRAGGTVRELLRRVEGNETVASVGEPTKRAKWRAFPVDTLPEPLRRFVCETSVAMGCDPVFAALPALSTIAAAVGNSRRVRLKPGWTEPAVLWTAAVGESGTTKSPPYFAAIEPLLRRQSEARARHDDAMRDFEDARATFDAQFAEWKRAKHLDDPPVAPTEPVLVRSVVSDTTVEALAVVLADNPRGVLLAREELSGWFKSFGAYKNGRGGDEAHYLSMHGARSLDVDRKTGDRKSIHVARAAVSIAGTIQPQVLSVAFGREQFESGMAARFLLAHPPRRAKQWTEATVAPATTDEYDALVTALHALEPGTDEHDSPEPVDVSLDDDARAAWIAYYDRHGARQADAIGDEASLLAKIEGAAARFALLFYLVRSAGAAATFSARIDAESAKDGIQLAEWFADEGARIYEEFHRSPEEHDLDELADWVRRKGGRVTVRQAMRGLRRLRGDEKKARHALDELVCAGRGQWLDVRAGARGGRQTEESALTDALADAATSASATEPSTAGSNSRVVSPSPPGHEGGGKS